MSRPNIEDRLGRHSDTEVEDLPSARSSRSKESELDNTLVAEPEGFGEDQDRRLVELTTHRQRLEVPTLYSLRVFSLDHHQPITN